MTDLEDNFHVKGCFARTEIDQYTKFIHKNDSDKEFKLTDRCKNCDIDFEERHYKFQFLLKKTSFGFDFGHFDEGKIKQDAKLESLKTMRKALLKHIEVLIQEEIIKIRERLHEKFKIRDFDKNIRALERIKEGYIKDE